MKLLKFCAFAFLTLSTAITASAADLYTGSASTLSLYGTYTNALNDKTLTSSASTKYKDATTAALAYAYQSCKNNQACSQSLYRSMILDLDNAIASRTTKITVPTSTATVKAPTTSSTIASDVKSKLK
jgi:hypothetical protein